MSSDYGKELLRSGIIEAKAGNRESARRYLDRAAYMSNDHDVLAEAWYWMSQVVDNAVEKRKALENCSRMTYSMPGRGGHLPFSMANSEPMKSLTPSICHPRPLTCMPPMPTASCVPNAAGG